MGGWPVGYLHSVVEEWSALPRTNPDGSRVEDVLMMAILFCTQNPLLTRQIQIYPLKKISEIFPWNNPFFSLPLQEKANFSSKPLNDVDKTTSLELTFATSSELFVNRRGVDIIKMEWS